MAKGHQQGLGLPLWVAMARVPEPCRTKSSACSLGLPVDLLAQDEVTCRAPGKRLEFALPPSPPEDLHSVKLGLECVHEQLLVDSCLLGEGHTGPDQWLGRATDGHSLTVPHLGRHTGPDHG